MDYMKANGIQTDIHYPTPPYLAKPYLSLGYKRGDFPSTEHLYSRIVSIPIFNGMTNQEIDTIIKTINAYE